MYEYIKIETVCKDLCKFKSDQFPAQSAAMDIGARKESVSSKGHTSFGNRQHRLDLVV